MTLEEGVADLHMHTTASDGKSSVKERAEQAKERGLEAIAITDHDCISEVLENPVQKIGDVEVITGVEIKADISGTKIEILGYYVDPNNEKLSSILGEAREFRRERNKELAENFVEVTGIDTSYEDMKERNQGLLGRPHFAEVLIEEGLVDSVSEAFEEYLDENGDIYVPTEKVDYRRVIDGVHDAGGAASLAHPGRIDTEGVPELVEEVAGYGLDGIEVWYPYENTRDYESEVGVKEASELAREYELVRTGGSDCHGESSGKFRIGEVRAPAESLEDLNSQKRG